MTPDSSWLIFILLLLLDLLFAALRGSVLNARLPLLINLAEEQPEAVQRAMKLLEKPRLRTSLRLAVVLVHFGLAVTAVWILAHTIQVIGYGWVLGAAVLCALLLSALEHLLEGLLLPNAERWALRFTSIAQTINLIMTPLSSLYIHLLGSPVVVENRLKPVTEYELRNWVEETETEGSLEKDERQMIYSIFHFGDTLCREIMIPRIDIFTLDVTTPLEEAIRALAQSGHSRVPIYNETVDNVVGVLYSKDLLRTRLGDQSSVTLPDLLRPAYYVPESKKVADLMEEMQAKRIHMAIVVDEYGGVAGLVTLEDIVEEIVGEIRDEYDQAETPLFQQSGAGEFIFQGRIDLDDFNEVMDSHISKETAETLGGLIYALIGRVPAEGEKVEVDGLTLQVEHVSGRRIRTVRASRSADQEETKEKEHGSEQ